MKSSPGFSLLQLAIVLVIVGLITGSIFVGTDLIKGSETKSVLTDIDKLHGAVNAFDTKYGCLPGDCANATTYFPAATNGNGDGLIGKFGTASTYAEVWQAFYELGAAGLIPGTYTGSAGSGGTRNAVPGKNVMAARIANAGYTLVGWANYSDANCFSPSTEASYPHNAILFGTSASNTNETYAPAVTALQAAAIDGKVDDGAPGTGYVVAAFPVTYPNCTTTAVPSTAKYQSTAKISCGLIFFEQFQ